MTGVDDLVRLLDNARTGRDVVVRFIRNEQQLSVKIEPEVL